MDGGALWRCGQCDAPLQRGDRFCPGCGSPLPLAAAAAAAPEGELVWETELTLLNNPLILKQTVLVVGGAGLFMALLLSFILALSGDYGDIPRIWLIALCTTLGLGLLLLFVMLLFFRNRMAVRFTVNAKGVLWETIDRRARAAGRLAILVGLLGRRPGTAGAGALAVAREKEFVRWQDLRAVTYDEKRLLLTLRNSWRPVMLVSCLPQNYKQVAAYIRGKVVPAAGAASASGGRENPLLRGLRRTLLVSLAAAPTFVLSSYPFELDIFLPLLLFLFALATVWLVPLFGWVVIGCAVVLALQIAGVVFVELGYLDGVELTAILVSYAGLAYLVWFSWASLRGKVRSALMEN